MGTARQAEAARVLEECGGNVTHAAARMGITRATLRGLARKGGGENAKPDFELPELPSKKMPTDRLIEHMCSRYEARAKSHNAREWFPIKVNTPGPIGLMWFGDPHVDDDGCNWPLLKRHVELVKRTKGMFACNIGDSNNNWVGRLARLYANQETSAAQAWQLVEWLMKEMPWMVIISGNHGQWSGAGDPLKYIIDNAQSAYHEWQAKFRIVFPNKREARIWAAHDFPGHSQWNGLHGPMKRAAFTGAADLYICGHRHQWQINHTEDGERGKVNWAVRVGSYKKMDEYAEKLGHSQQELGCAVATIIDPNARTEASFMTCFADPEEGAEYLMWKRKKARV